jgi:hypothetical protein
MGNRNIKDCNQVPSTYSTKDITLIFLIYRSSLQVHIARYGGGHEAKMKYFSNDQARHFVNSVVVITTRNQYETVKKYEKYI